MRRGASSAARLNRNRKSRMKSLWHPEHFGYGQALNSFEKHVTKSDYPVHRCCFIFLFVLFENVSERGARERSINPSQFLFFYHARSTDFEEKIEGLGTGKSDRLHHHSVYYL